MLGEILQKPIEHRMVAWIAAAVYAFMQGVSMIRTHDVAETKQALKILQAVV